jgi:protein-tyrosine phosphatase
MRLGELGICFVCLGNICRSPTAESVMRRLIDEAGLKRRIHVESAGTGDDHVGERPDLRMRQAARRRGLSLAGRARQFLASDFRRFDYVLAMDAANLVHLERLRPASASAVHLGLLRDFEPGALAGADVPDPYYGGPRGFEEVLDLCEVACRGLLEHVRGRAGPG